MTVDTFLVFGGGGPSGHPADWSHRLVRACADRGYRIHVADLADNLVCVPQGEPVAGVHAVDFRDVDACVRLAKTLDPGDGSLGVVGFREYALLSAAEAARVVGAPWNSPERVRLVRDKHGCRRFLAERGFAQPDGATFRTAAEAASWLEGRSGRWVVKPGDALGSQGVTAVQLPAAREDLAASAESALRYSSTVIAEQFVEGPEYSAEGIVLDGRPYLLGITEKSTSGPPHFVETGHVQPPVRPVDTAAVEQVVLAAVRAVGFTHSLFHVEFWDTPDGIVLGEVHARGGGDWIHRLVIACHDEYDMIAAILDSVAGRPVELPPANPRLAAAVQVVTATVAGTVTGVSGVDEVAADPDCLAVDVLVSPGTEVGPDLQDSFSRLGMIVARAADPAGARAKACELAGRIRIDVAAPTASSTGAGDQG